MKELEDLLPPQYANKPWNTRNCLVTPDESTTPYILIHLLYLHCRVVLHREYIPWVPLQCKSTGPVGPLDPPIFPLERYGNAEWWTQSAEKLWAAARGMSDLLELCEEYKYRLETPLPTFLIYQVAFCGKCNYSQTAFA